MSAFLGYSYSQLTETELSGIKESNRQLYVKIMIVGYCGSILSQLLGPITGSVNRDLLNLKLQSKPIIEHVRTDARLLVNKEGNSVLKCRDGSDNGPIAAPAEFGITDSNFKPAKVKYLK